MLGVDEDDEHGDAKTYKIQVYTGDVIFAGTDANVFINVRLPRQY
jgi:hypothetical protein